ncbi:MAG: bi-domain-containing oxidoreductase [Bacteroidota bacterium]|nr:bi-domain-containing oxidoreductase [Bacteroidota bacterium]
MKQVAIESKKGTMLVDEVPDPLLRAGGVIVRNHFSLISAGTERTSVQKRQEGMLAKAKANPELVKAVLQQMKQQGLLATYKKVMTRMGAYGAMGYSSAGSVLAVANDIEDFVPGDHVACAGGGYASHAELIFVPKNLCAKIPSGVTTQEAAYTTVGAIALQGVRQAAPTLGETIVVIGLGLVGQLAVQIAKAAGCNVIGIDVDKHAVALAKSLGADAAFSRASLSLVSDVQSFTHGYGADAVIITAATKSNDPVQIAGELCRDKGRVVLVGDVGITLPRAPYYMKELDFRLSRSYGPGRYDRSYEEKGSDYPIGYVRWTERRNMEEFLRLVQQKKVGIGKLTTHVFPIDNAVEAYRLISGKSNQRYLGVLIEYPQEKHRKGSQHEAVKKISLAPSKGKTGALSIGFIGAGNFAQASLLPHLAGKNVMLKGVCTGSGLNAKNVARQFGFEFATTDPKEICGSDAIDAVFIATRHNLHASLCAQAIRHNKHVFVEKPLALSDAELDAVVRAYNASLKHASLRFLVGFNRRFSPSVRTAKEFFAGTAEPMMVMYRINAGFLPKTHWTQDPIEGGGRIIGEVCHFIDTIQFLTGALPTKVFAQSLSLKGNRTQSDNVAITLRLSNGSVGVITYLANGDTAVSKEFIEIHAGRKTAVLDNFKRLELYEGGTRNVHESSVVEKGHKTEVEEFIEAIHTGRDLVSFESVVATTRATFRILESLETGMPVEV